VSEAAPSARPLPAEGPLGGLESGTQALVDRQPMGSAIARLPESALSNLLVVTVGRDVGTVADAVREADGDPTNVGVVPVSATPVGAEAGVWTAPRVGPSDLTGVSIGIARGMRYVQPAEGWLLFDDLGVLLMHAEESRVYQLLTTLSAKCRSRDVRGVYALSRAAVGEGTYARFRELFDVEVGLD